MESFLGEYPDELSQSTTNLTSELKPYAYPRSATTSEKSSFFSFLFPRRATTSQLRAFPGQELSKPFLSDILIKRVPSAQFLFNLHNYLAKLGQIGLSDLYKGNVFVREGNLFELGLTPKAVLRKFY